MVKKILFLIAFLAAFGAEASVNTYTTVFDPAFRTLKVSVPDDFMAPPVIRLGSSDRLVFSFDEIGEDNSWLQYRLIHCDASWQPSRLVESEYIDGFNVADIEDFAYSQNTYVHFVNYRIEFPSNGMRPLVSGNYLLQVFRRDSPGDPVLQARFMVVEPGAGVSGSVTTRTDRGVNTEWQQLGLAVDLSSLETANQYQDITVSVSQNGCESSRRYITKPLRVTGASAVYEHIPELVFPAGNEYRRFETVSTGFPGMGADSVKYMGSNYHVWLCRDEGRALRGYEFDSTQRGRFLVREYNATDSDLGADYVTVHFSLDIPPVADSDIYVDGEMTHGAFSAANRMTYDTRDRVYRLQMPLKQGAYNYRYVAVPRVPGGIPSAALTEGNKYETRNEYQTAVYYRPPGARADRLVGFAVFLAE